jgi:hypothetical protein
MKKFFAIALLLAGTSAFAADPVNITGKWSVHASVSGTDSDAVCNFVVTDGKITGSCKHDDNDHPLTGVVDGTKVMWKYDSEYNGSPITLTYRATVTDAKKFSGSLDVDPFGVTGDFTAILSAEASK